MATFSDYLKRRGAVTGPAGEVVTFAGAAAEYHNLAGGGATLVPMTEVTPLRLTGEDALTFAHGQLSNEVQGLKPGEANTSLMLNVKGHALAQIGVYRRRSGLHLAVEGGAGATVAAQLDAHIIFDQVTIEDLSGSELVMTLQGAHAADTLHRALAVTVPKPKTFVEASFAGTSVLVAHADRTGFGGADLHVSTDGALELFELLESAGAVMAGREALDYARVAAGIPEAWREGGEGVLPQEAGLEPFVSYTKGCYLGQEIMARIEARGSVRRSLRGLILAGEPPRGASHLTAGGRTVGRAGTVVAHPIHGVIGLGVIRKDVDSSASLDLAGTDVRMAELPFWAELAR